MEYEKETGEENAVHPSPILASEEIHAKMKEIVFKSMIGLRGSRKLNRKAIYAVAIQKIPLFTIAMLPRQR